MGKEMMKAGEVPSGGNRESEFPKTKNRRPMKPPAKADQGAREDQSLSTIRSAKP
jgi:hypothetical protein